MGGDPRLASPQALAELSEDEEGTRDTSDLSKTQATLSVPLYGKLFASTLR